MKDNLLGEEREGVGKRGQGVVKMFREGIEERVMESVCSCCHGARYETHRNGSGFRVSVPVP